MAIKHEPFASPSGRVRVAVVGAGVSGLAAAKCLRDEGIEPVVFEQAREIGGVWNFHEEEPDGGGPAYRSLRTNTSKQTTAFSDFPFPASLPDFPGRAQVRDYLNDYADRFALHELVQLRTQVDQIVPSGAHGPWKVTYHHDAPVEKLTDAFDAVVVCSGIYRSPAVPHYPGSETFCGEIMHSHIYKGPEGFEDKDVIVVGTGSSGVDIAVELSAVARSLTLSTERGAWFLPRYVGAKPYDHLLTRLSGLVPYGLRMRLFQRMLFAEYKRMGISNPRVELGTALPKKDLDLLKERLTTSSEIPRCIAAGTIITKPGIARLEGWDAVFSGGTRSRADAIVLATGYDTSFPFLDGSIAGRTADMAGLYKYVFHPELRGLAFLGMCIVAGPVIPVIEMQARWVARVLAGRATLPARSRMQTDVQARRARLARTGAHPMRVLLIEYMDDLAGEIGVRPRPSRHLALVMRLLAGPLVAAQYRLDGPGRWPHAGRAIREAALPAGEYNTGRSRRIRT